MDKKIQRYLVPADGPEVEPIKNALSLLAQLCQKLDSDAILLIPTKRNMRGTTVETALGIEVSKILSKGGQVTLPGGKKLRLETVRTFQALWSPDIIFGVLADKKMLDLIDSMKNASAVIVVPWIMSEVSEWKRAWNPQVLGESPTTAEVLIDNPVVEEALKMLTDSVNLSTGLSHPSDKAAAVELLRLLYRNGESFDVDSIRAWVLRNEWDPKGANQLGAVAQAILNRRPIRGSKYLQWPTDIIQQIRNRVKK